MHLNCPHCHNPIEIVDDGSAESSCPSCGSSIDLKSARANKTKTWDGKGPIAMRVGRFECVSWLGEGAFGTVWKARDPELGIERAVKVPRPGVLGGPEFEETFLREARAAAALRHDGIVAIHEAGRQDGTVYIVSDLIRGVTLAEWLSGKRPDFRQAAELIAELADALDYAHRQGVVHRDLKPANIMLRLEPESGSVGWDQRRAGPPTTSQEMVGRRSAGPTLQTSNSGSGKWNSPRYIVGLLFDCENFIPQCGGSS
jgi:serine/threonine protein kinase